MRRLLTLALVLMLLGSCSHPIQNKPLWPDRADRAAGLPIPASVPLHWRDENARNADLIALALSGGGVKASTFSGEVMFYLDAIGLLPKVKLISSVSGGSYAAARYAISCDEVDRGTVGCETADRRGPRPVWNYTQTMPVFTKSFETLLWGVAPGLLAGLVVPGVSPTVSPTTYAGFLSKHYLQADDGGDVHYTFGDIDEARRPRVVLNATLVSDYRNLTEGNIGTGYLRRRNGDEYFHFSFTDYFFNHIGSDYRSLPLEYGVAASGAFPTLIGYVPLTDYRRCAREQDAAAEQQCWNSPKQQLALIDGGANDNQGLAEIYATIGEILLHQARSDLSTNPPVHPGLLPMRVGDRALILAINSSITVATGLQGAQDDGWFLLNNINRSLQGVDVYSGTAVNLRLRLYLQNLEIVNGQMRRGGWPNDAVDAQEIGLVTLDDYPMGGPESANVWLAGIRLPKPISPEACTGAGFDNIACELALPRWTQAKAFNQVRKPETRASLGLSGVHPQCLFEQSKLSDVNLMSIDQPISDCLRQAARWATALRMQELCMRPMSPLNDMRPLACDHGNFTRLSNRKPGVNTGFLAECRFVANTDEQNRDILVHLRDNPVFSGETASSPRHLDITGIKPDQLKGDALAHTIEDICDLDKMYPHS